MLALYFVFYPFDYYADNLVIPDGIELNVPGDSIPSVWVPGNKFEIYNDVQQGIYTYEAGLKTIEKGTVYLKAYEVTKNDRLSAEELSRYTSVPVENTGDSIVRYSSKESFTISEGDWGDPYAARFELWFKPVNGTERKIAEKIYKIEGWQR